LTSTSANDIICHLKSNFAKHGIPAEVFTDNRPQFSANLFSTFSQSYGFTHKTSSPRHLQSNGEAVRAVRTIKNILTKSDDPYLGLLAYRTTLLENGYSPAELLMGRRICTTIPTVNSQFKPKLPNNQMVRKKEATIKQRQKSNYDRRHRVRSLSPLKEGDNVLLPDGAHGQMTRPADMPRSYQVETDTGTLRRNRRQLTNNHELTSKNHNKQLT